MPQVQQDDARRRAEAGHPYYDLFAAGPSNGAASIDLLSPDEVWAKSSLKEEERDRVKSELDDKERILWTGRPDAGIAFKRGWILASAWFFMTIMAIVLLIILNISMPEFGLMGNLLVILVGLVTIAGGIATPYYKRWLAEKQFYTVSDKRATIWGCTKFGKILPPCHFEPAELHRMYITPSQFGGEDAGDLIFGSRTVTRGTGKDATTVTYTWGFFMLRGAKEAEKIIREVLVTPLLDKAYE